jgi:hypothetical protein
MASSLSDVRFLELHVENSTTSRCSTLDHPLSKHQCVASTCWYCTYSPLLLQSYTLQSSIVGSDIGIFHESISDFICPFFCSSCDHSGRLARFRQNSRIVVSQLVAELEKDYSGTQSPSLHSWNHIRIHAFSLPRYPTQKQSQDGSVLSLACVVGS